MPQSRKPSTAKNGRNRDAMDNLLRRSGIVLPQSQLDALWSYHKLLRRYNPDLNLTRIHNFANMVIKLYVDSILPGKMIDLPSPLLDIGSGPGMPGIPLKIAFPDLQVILAESRQNRADFLQTVTRTLALENVSVVGHGITPKYRQPVSGVITRAVEHIDKTLARIEGCLAENGLAVFMKGPRCDDEVDRAVARFGDRYELVKNQPYQIPHSPHHRRLVVFRRTDAPLWGKKADAMTRHRFRAIDSEQNPTYKDLKKLLTGRGIKKQQKAIIAGAKQVAEVIGNFPKRCEAWISKADQPPPPAGAPDRMAWYQLSADLFSELDVNGTHAPLLLINTPEIGTWRGKDGFLPGCSVLVAFQDPENVGTIIRSAVAFGARRIILLSESAHPYHPKAIRASGGAVLHAELSEGPSIGNLPAELPLVCLSGEGTDIADFKFPEAFGLLPGVEGTGLPAQLRDRAVSIPISDAVESLNGATAAGIALYLWASSTKRGQSE
ncbi:MAG: 16S rRNA (guanine(527)-N(7))-methyltransferase RsmG [Thermodesulfobacteriota bacterium]